MDDYVKAASRHRQPREVSPCLNDSQIVAFYSCQLNESETESIRAHLTDCPECLELARDARQFLQFMSGPVEADAAAISAPSLSPTPQAPEHHGRVSWWHTLTDTLQNPALGVSMAAAALVLLVAGSVLVAINWRLHNQVERLRAEQGDPQEHKRELERQLAEVEKLRGERADLQKQLAAQASGQKGSMEQGRLPVRLVMLVLRPGLVRGFDNPNTLVMPEGADRVGLEIHLEKDDYASYHAVLRTADGKTIWQRGGMKARRLASGRYVSLSLPSALFTKRDYVLRLTGVDSGGRSEDVAQYVLQVSRQ
jgi:cell division protein FtsB